MKKRISIIVPCYKVEKYLPRCLDSLLNQTMNDIEIICVNDGSPDKCIEVLNSYKRQYGDKIVIIDKANEGVWQARKDGIKIATGEFIGFVDADDYVAPNFLEKLYDAINKEDADIAVCGFDRIDMKTGNLYSREMCKKRELTDFKKNPDKLLSLNTALWNKMYRTSALKEMEEVSTVPRVGEDMVFLMLLLLNANTVTYIPDSLVYYMVRTDSAMNGVKELDVKLTFDAMQEVRYIYEKKRPELLPVVDAMAFLHMGVSLMFRISYNKNCDLKKHLKENRESLEQNFPHWKRSKYLTLGYMLKNGFDNYKLWIVHGFYKLHLFRFFLLVYRFMIDKMKIDIKW